MGDVVFGGGLWPLGWEVGFLEAPFEDVVAAVRRWLDELGDRRSTREQNLGDAPLLELLGALLPIQTPQNRELLVGTKGRWTAHFANSGLGGDSASRVGHLSDVLGTRGVVASHVPRDQYPLPATQFELFGPGGDALGYVRTIACGVYDEGRWRFDTFGDVQPFEETEAYARHLKRERFTREMLVRYLRALGIDAVDEAFYTRAVLFENRRIPDSGARSLEEIRAGYFVP